MVIECAYKEEFADGKEFCIYYACLVSKTDCNQCNIKGIIEEDNYEGNN